MLQSGQHRESIIIQTISILRPALSDLTPEHIVAQRKALKLSRELRARPQ